MSSTSYLMSCGDKAWILLIGLTSYIYSPSLVVRQFRGTQYFPRTWGLAKYIGVFKEANFVVELDTIICDWKGELVLGCVCTTRFNSFTNRNIPSECD